MARITALAIADQLTGDEHLPIVQGLATKRVTMRAFRDLITPFLQNWYKGDRGDPGMANSTYAGADKVSSQALVSNGSAIVADPSRGGTFAYKTGNFAARFAADPLQAIYIPAILDPAGLKGAWVRIGVGRIDACWFGAIGDGETDSTAAIQAALDYAGYLSIQDEPFEGFGYVLKGGAEVYLPAGAYRTADTLEVPQNVSFSGAGKHSTIIVSTSERHVLRNRAKATTQGSYDRSGMALRNFSIIGDRTKPNQVGLGLLRMMAGIVENIHVSKCGSHGIELLQIGNSTFNNIESVRNVGHGLEIGRGKDDWGLPDNQWPSNANVFNFYGGLQNDGAGIHLRPGTNGNLFLGPVCQYNFLAGGNNNGFQVLSETDSYVPNVMVRLWTEGPCDTHVYVYNQDISTAIVLEDWEHFGDGEQGTVNRALHIQRGTARLVRPVSPTNKYRTIAGSNAPFRINDLVTAVLEVADAEGADLTGLGTVEGPDGTVVGLENNLKLRSPNTVYGPIKHFMANGGVAADEWFTDTLRDHPYFRIEPFHKALAFGDGSAEPDVMLKRVGERTLGLDTRGGLQTFRAGFFAHEPVPVAQLPSPYLPALPGRRGFVSDSNMPAEGNAGQPVQGGGSYPVPVYHDGTTWRIG
jgi:hypothetical protein